MCVLAFAWRPNARWRLVVAGNRDELHARPSQPLSRWDEHPQLLAGRDLVAGGTWLGVSEGGRFAVVTNIRGGGPPDPELRSRGALIVDLLTGGGSSLDQERASRFNPFNIISADRDEAIFVANRPAFQRRPLVPGVYGLSNADLDAPWPKTIRLRSGLEEWLSREDAGPAELLTLLAEGREKPLQSLAAPHLSPVFMRNAMYGTRCSTVVLVDAEGHGTMVERSYSPDAEVTGEVELKFSWPG
jgi:uncharacterized protein with NRDE domain